VCVCVCVHACVHGCRRCSLTTTSPPLPTSLSFSRARSLSLSLSLSRYVFGPCKMDATRWGGGSTSVPRLGAGLTSSAEDYWKFLRQQYLGELLPAPLQVEMETDQYVPLPALDVLPALSPNVYVPIPALCGPPVSPHSPSLSPPPPLQQPHASATCRNEWSPNKIYSLAYHLSSSHPRPPLPLAARYPAATRTSFDDGWHYALTSWLDCPQGVKEWGPLCEELRVCVLSSLALPCPPYSDCDVRVLSEKCACTKVTTCFNRTTVPVIWCSVDSHRYSPPPAPRPPHTHM
jgi:hypothetical protein